MTQFSDWRLGHSDMGLLGFCTLRLLKKKDSYRNSGIVSLTYLDIQKPYSFLDYIKGGTQIHCSFAIDFTASNGNPTSSHSLHFLSSVPNSYEIAIQSVGNIIKDYDSDQSFPVLGFGAYIPPHGAVSQEFFVNLAQDDPYCKGIEGVLTAYRNCLRQVKLSGPSHFAPVINHVAKFAMAYRDGTNYFILLLMTDGYISDMRKTKQAVVSASVLPMSIIIVGVGPAYFGSMKELDSDETLLKAPDGSRAARDIVQFVTLRDFMTPGEDYHMAMAKLAKEVLAEIPSQFLSYMRFNKIVPPPGAGNTLPAELPLDPEFL
ncbi:copine-8-like [Hetaerina americana]|uniref:copine-8-like n=1 Tax=Hetaerina americana TaxID=62018 RepID=UPI003A7F54A4